MIAWCAAFAGVSLTAAMQQCCRPCTCALQWCSIASDAFHAFHESLGNTPERTNGIGWLSEAETTAPQEAFISLNSPFCSLKQHGGRGGARLDAKH